MGCDGAEQWIGATQIVLAGLMAFAIRAASLLASSVMHAVQHAKRCGCSANCKLLCVDKGHKATSVVTRGVSHVLRFSSTAIEIVPIMTPVVRPYDRRQRCSEKLVYERRCVDHTRGFWAYFGLGRGPKP